MNLSFNSDGNLHKTIEMSFEEFREHFGTNACRQQKIETAIEFLRIFSSCGCNAMYVAGSFVSMKVNPEDIDLLFDLTEVDKEALEIAIPGFFDENRHNTIGKIRRDSKCHIFTFENNDLEVFKMLQWDRNDYPKGMVKISFQNDYNL